nr:hypothetical protein [Tanacetum cinerariifolium]
MDANKKIDLIKPQCPNESKIIRDIRNHHPLRFSLVDVPRNQSQLIKSTQGTHRTLSAPRTPNPATTQGKSSGPRKPTIIRFHGKNQPNPKTPIPTSDELNITNLQEVTQVSIDTERSLEDLEAQQNVEKKRKGIEKIKDTPTPIRSPGTHIAPLSSDRETLQELTVTDPTPSSCTPIISTLKPKQDRFKHYKSVFNKMCRRYGYMFRHLKQSFMPRKDFNEMEDIVKSMMNKVIPLMVDKRVNKFAKKFVPLYVAEGLLLDKQKDQTDISSLVAQAVKKKRENIRPELSMQFTNDVANTIPSQVDSFLQDYMSTNTLHVHPTKPASSCVYDLQYHMYLKMKDDDQSLKEEMHEMRKNYNYREGDHASKNDDTLMCERHEASYIQSE